MSTASAVDLFVVGFGVGRVSRLTRGELSHYDPNRLQPCDPSERVPRDQFNRSLVEIAQMTYCVEFGDLSLTDRRRYGYKLNELRGMIADLLLTK